MYRTDFVIPCNIAGLTLETNVYNFQDVLPTVQSINRLRVSCTITAEQALSYHRTAELFRNSNHVALNITTFTAECILERQKQECVLYGTLGHDLTCSFETLVWIFECGEQNALNNERLNRAEVILTEIDELQFKIVELKDELESLNRASVSVEDMVKLYPSLPGHDVEPSF
jgi:hypothetical protein